MTLLVEGLNAHYGSSHVLHDVSLRVEAGEAVALLGRNGAGKTTTLHSIIGFMRRTSGSVRLDDVELLGRPPHEISRRGVGLVAETRRIFATMSVAENLRVAVDASPDESRRRWSLESVMELFPDLHALRASKGGALSGGEQQMLAIARTLLTNPSTLLLDEPSEGLAPKIVDQLAEQLVRIRETGVTILISEQNLAIANALTERAYVIEKGRIEHEGSSSALLEDSEVRRRYLAV
jgi:branched-chain amino acid transport system ATP-binding protein